MRKPINTTQEAKDNPFGVLAAAMILGSGPSGHIERQEAEGQRSFVNSDTLSAEMDAEAKAILEGAGIKFLGPVDGDPLFQYVELPQGWKKERADHSMWSHLLDAKGRKRASIFYKAAFYDRRAELTIERRFDYERNWNIKDAVQFQITDCGKPILVFAAVPIPEGKESWDVDKEPQEEAVAWLNGQYPDWQNPAAYWD